MKPEKQQMHIARRPTAVAYIHNDKLFMTFNRPTFILMNTCIIEIFWNYNETNEYTWTT